MSNVTSYNFRVIRIIQEYVQPKNRQKNKNIQPGLEKQHSYIKKSVTAITVPGSGYRLSMAGDEDKTRTNEGKIEGGLPRFSPVLLVLSIAFFRSPLTCESLEQTNNFIEMS